MPQVQQKPRVMEFFYAIILRAIDRFIAESKDFNHFLSERGWSVEPWLEICSNFLSGENIRNNILPAAVSYYDGNAAIGCNFCRPYFTLYSSPAHFTFLATQSIFEFCRYILHSLDHDSFGSFGSVCVQTIHIRQYDKDVCPNCICDKIVERMSLSLKFTLYPSVTGMSSSTDVTSFSFIIGSTPQLQELSQDVAGVEVRCSARQILCGKENLSDFYSMGLE